MNESEIIGDLKGTWQEKVDNHSEWSMNKKSILRLPDKLSKENLGLNYYIAIAECALALHLEIPYYFEVALDVLNSLVLLRKLEAIVISLKSISIRSEFHLDLISKVVPQSTVFLSIFKSSSIEEIIALYPSLTSEISNFLAHQLPFKCKDHKEELKKLGLLVNHYSLSDKCLLSISKVWASQSFLIHSLDQNQSIMHIGITLLIYDLMHAKLTPEITEQLFPGIQMRLSSNIKDISSSGLVIYIKVIASRVGQLLNSKEIIEFTMQDYLQGKEYDDHTSSSENEDEFNGEIVKVRYLEDLMQGLLSQDRSRLISSMESAAALITEELSDLDLSLEHLSEILLKIENTFNFADFEECRFKSLVALACLRPIDMCRILIHRLSDSGCSIAGKLLVFDVIRETSRKLANPPEFVQTKKKEKASKYHIIQERLKLKTRRFVSKPRPVNLGRPNLFFQHFERFCSGVVGAINTKLNYLALSKAIYTLSELIENAGESCDVNMITQCTYIIRYVIKPFISSEKREVVESVLILFITVAQKLDINDLLSDYSSILQDINEIALKIEQLSGELQDLADSCLLLLVKYRI